MTKTVLIHDVPAVELQQILHDLKGEGYNTAYYLEPDAEFTVIGTKTTPDMTRTGGLKPPGK